MATQDLPPDILEQLKNPTVRRLLAETMMGEAGGEGPRGQQAVEDVILNRAIESGMSIQDVINAPNQFTSMGPRGSRGRLDAVPAASLAPEMNVIANPNAAWTLPRNVDAFLNPTLQADMSRRDPTHYHGIPSWGQGTPAETIGRHQFFATGYKGGGAPGQPTGQGGQQAGGQVPQIPGFQEALTTAVQKEGQLQPEVEAALDKKGELLQSEFDAAQAYRKSLQGISDRFQASNQKIIDSLPDEQKLRQEELAKVSDQPNDPTRVFGQLLPMLAVFGGAFTKAGVTGSLNAAAAAMNAARGHDETALKNAHAQFQDQLQQVQEKASLLHEEMADALASSNGDWNAYLASMNILAAKYDIPAAKLAAEQGSVKDLLAINDGLFKTSMEVQNQAIKMAELDLKEKEFALKDASQFDSDANEYLATVGRYGNLPGAPRLPSNLGMGETPERARIANQMAADAKQRWGTDNAQVAAIADIGAAVGMHAKGQGLVTLSKQIPPLQAYVNGLDGISTLLQKAAGGKGAGELWGAWWNKPLRALRAQGGGDAQVVQLNALAKAVQDEYAKVLSGSTGSVRAASDSEIKQMQSVISGDMTPEQIYAVLDTMHQETTARLAGYRKAFNDDEQDITAEAERHTTPGAPDDQSPAAPPPANDPLGLR